MTPIDHDYLPAGDNPYASGDKAYHGCTYHGCARPYHEHRNYNRRRTR